MLDILNTDTHHLLVRVMLADGPTSFCLAKAAPLSELARHVRTMDVWHVRAPLSIDVEFVASSNEHRTSSMPRACSLGTQH